MNRAGWRIAAASAIGTSHQRRGLVCQDRHACQVRADGVAIFVIADGAGSADHSELGAAIACETMQSAIGTYLDDGGAIAAIDRELALNWLARARTAIAELAAARGDAVRAYACTLLALVVGEECAACMQVGDGCAVVFDKEHGWEWLHWPQRGEFANTTIFATDDCAPEMMAFRALTSRVEEAALFTDGVEALVLHYATRTVHAPFFQSVLPPVRASAARGIDEHLSKMLASYLESPVICDRTDDDKTLILATRREAGAA